MPATIFAVWQAQVMCQSSSQRQRHRGFCETWALQEPANPGFVGEVEPWITTADHDTQSGKLVRQDSGTMLKP